jgi:hypothetical protein
MLSMLEHYTMMLYEVSEDKHACIRKLSTSWWRVVYRRSGGTAALTLHAGEWLLSLLVSLCMGCVDPRTGLDMEGNKKLLFLSGIEPSVQLGGSY